MCVCVREISPNLVKLQCYVKLLKCFHNKQYTKAIIFQMSVVVYQQESSDVCTGSGGTTVCYSKVMEYVY